MSSRELHRIQVLEQVKRGLLTLVAAAVIPKVCYRQAKRLLARYRRQGPKGMAHHCHEEELAGIRFLTHVGRVLQELSVAGIPAYSAQAKGRIERQGRTLQYRLRWPSTASGISPRPMPG